MLLTTIQIRSKIRIRDSCKANISKLLGWIYCGSRLQVAQVDLIKTTFWPSSISTAAMWGGACGVGGRREDGEGGYSGLTLSVQYGVYENTWVEEDPVLEINDWGEHDLNKKSCENMKWGNYCFWLSLNLKTTFVWRLHSRIEETVVEHLCWLQLSYKHHHFKSSSTNFILKKHIYSM